MLPPLPSFVDVDFYDGMESRLWDLLSLTITALVDESGMRCHDGADSWVIVEGIIDQYKTWSACREEISCKAKRIHPIRRKTSAMDR